MWISAAAIAVLGLAVVGTLALGALFFVGSFGYYLDDEWYPEGEDYFVEQGSVESAVEEPCADMIDAASAISIFDDRSAGAASIAAFAESGRAIVEAIDGANPNEGSQAWRDDWSQLIESLDEFARELRGTGDADFAMPDAGDGFPLAERMSYGSPGGCEVPLIIAALDSDAAGQPYYVY